MSLGRVVSAAVVTLVVVGGSIIPTGAAIADEGEGYTVCGTTWDYKKGSGGTGIVYHSATYPSGWTLWGTWSNWTGHGEEVSGEMPDHNGHNTCGN